jgi:hypothetical protein
VDLDIAAAASDEEIVAEFGRITETGGGLRRSAVSALARKYGRASRDVYRIIERAKESVE